ncbi:MAG: tol-pal system YbgF family protein [Gemmataceae bacterium]
MHRTHRDLFLCLGCGLLGIFVPQLALGQEKSEQVEVFFKTSPKTVKRFVVRETNKEVEFTKGYTIPAANIEDIDYRNYFSLQDQSRQIYSTARNLEAEAKKAKTLKQRHEHLQNAISKYKDVQEKLAANPKSLVLKKAPRHVQFKVAYITGLLGIGQNNRTRQIEAIFALENFKKKHGTNIWQYTLMVEMLVKLQTTLGYYDKAEAVVTELIGLKLATKVTNGVQIFFYEELMKAGKHATTLPKLSKLVAALPKGTDIRIRARLAEAQCTAATKKIDAAVEKVKAILNETKNNRFRGKAYNTLGLCYFESKDYQKAVWPFLWVDVIYNHDKEEHAKAMYYLWKSFKELGELDRAQRFYNSLRSDSQFVGTEYQRLAESD